MSWWSDANAWIGLVTLIGLEIVLGVDNLVFTAILADRLPPDQRRQARLWGLSLALVMRLALLAALSYFARLTAPLFSVAGWSFSGRDLILIGGGAFLLAKGTTELHERIEAGAHGAENGRRRPVFWRVIAQIILLDLVFSLDSIVTAVGMVDDLSIMIIAVIVAVGVMIVASGPLTAFVGRRPTVVILCLGFLLMIGFSLITEGFGFHIPKAYLYAAIVFSVLVESANELRRRNQTRRVATKSRRERIADAIEQVLNGAPSSDGEDIALAGEPQTAALRAEERAMVHGVLELGARRLRSLMTPRGSVEWLDLDAPHAVFAEKLASVTHSHVLLAKGRIDDVVGIAATPDLLRSAAEPGFDPATLAKPPLVLPHTLEALRAVERLREAAYRLAVVVDEHGSVQGVVTPFDILEAIAGDFPEPGEIGTDLTPDATGAILCDGSQDIRRVGTALGTDFTDAADRYATLAGFIGAKLQRLPNVGDRVTQGAFAFEVLALEGRNAGRIRIFRNEP